MTFSKEVSSSLSPISPADVDVFELSETSTLFIEVISSRIKKAKGFFQDMTTLSALNTAASAISLRGILGIMAYNVVILMRFGLPLYKALLLIIGILITRVDISPVHEFPLVE